MYVVLQEFWEWEAVGGAFEGMCFFFCLRFILVEFSIRAGPGAWSRVVVVVRCGCCALLYGVLWGCSKEV